MANNQVLFISEIKVKKNSDILNNVESHYIANAIEKMQRAKILPVTGSQLYNRIADMIVNNTLGDAGNETYYNMVIDYIQPSLIEFVTAELVVSNTYKITTKGLLQFENENSTGVELKTIQYLLKRYEDMGEYWLVRLRNYCLEKSKNGGLPDYLAPNLNNYETIVPDKRKAFASGIYLKGYRYGDQKEYWRQQDNSPY